MIVGSIFSLTLSICHWGKEVKGFFPKTIHVVLSGLNHRPNWLTYLVAILINSCRPDTVVLHSKTSSA